MTLVPEPQPEELTAFWIRAVTRAKLAQLPGVMGMSEDVAIEPPACAFGDGTVQLANRLAQLILDGDKTASSSYGPLYEAAEVSYPRVGDLTIVLNGQAHPVALLRNRKVALVPFNEIDAQVAQAEGEGDIEQWVAEHRRVFRQDAHDAGIEFDETAQVVVEYFDVMYRTDTDMHAATN